MGRQTKYLLGNGSHTHINIAIRWAPKPGKPASRGVIDHLQGPTKLSDDIGIGQRGHTEVIPGMHDDVILIDLEGGVEYLPVPDDIEADEKMGRLDLILLQEGKEVIGFLYGMCADTVSELEIHIREKWARGLLSWLLLLLMLSRSNLYLSLRHFSSGSRQTTLGRLSSCRANAQDSRTGRCRAAGCKHVIRVLQRFEYGEPSGTQSAREEHRKRPRAREGTPNCAC